MSKVKIFCEGITDQIFIADCLEIFWNISSQRKLVPKSDKIHITFSNGCEIIEVSGCTNLTNTLYLDQLRDNTEEGGRNLIVFDADFSTGNVLDSTIGTGNNGFANAKRKLENIQTQHQVVFDFYLWHNNGDDGEVENLLCQLIPTDKKIIFDCISNHQNCLKNSGLTDLKIADLKEAINFYLHTLNEETKPARRNYKLGHCWKLDHETIADLILFKDFLTPFFG